MIDKQTLQWCGFTQNPANLFFPMSIEVFYHPGGIWVPFSETPEVDILNEDQFSSEDIVLEGNSTDMEDFFFTFLHHFGETVYIRGFEDGINYDETEDQDDVLIIDDENDDEGEEE